MRFFSSLLNDIIMLEENVRGGMSMNTKHKLRISNIVNFCFFIFAYIILLVKLLSFRFSISGSSIISDIVFAIPLLAILIVMSFIFYLLPGLVLTRKVVFIKWNPVINRRFSSKLTNDFISFQNINKLISVYKC